MPQGFIVTELSTLPQDPSAQSNYNSIANEAATLAHANGYAIGSTADSKYYIQTVGCSSCSGGEPARILFVAPTLEGVLAWLKTNPAGA